MLEIFDSGGISFCAALSAAAPQREAEKILAAEAAGFFKERENGADLMAVADWNGRSKLSL